MTMSEREWRLERLRPLFAYMARHDTSLFSVAKRIGMKQPRMIYRLRDGKAQIPERFVERVCEALGVRPREMGYMHFRSTAPRERQPVETVEREKAS